MSLFPELSQPYPASETSRLSFETSTASILTFFCFGSSRIPTYHKCYPNTGSFVNGAQCMTLHQTNKGPTKVAKLKYSRFDIGWFTIPISINTHVRLWDVLAWMKKHLPRRENMRSMVETTWNQRERIIDTSFCTDYQIFDSLDTSTGDMASVQTSHCDSLQICCIIITQRSILPILKPSSILSFIALQISNIKFTSYGISLAHQRIAVSIWVRVSNAKNGEGSEEESGDSTDMFIYV